MMQPFVFVVYIVSAILTLRELKAPARFAFTVLFALNNAAIPRQEARRFQRAT